MLIKWVENLFCWKDWKDWKIIYLSGKWLYSSVTLCYDIIGIALCILHSQDKVAFQIHCIYSTELNLVGHLRAAHQSVNTTLIYSNLTHHQTVASSYTASKHTGTAAFLWSHGCFNRHESSKVKKKKKKWKWPVRIGLLK